MRTVKASRYRTQYPCIGSIRATVSDRVVHAETSIKRRYLARDIKAFRCRIRFNPESIRGVVIWKMFRAIRRRSELAECEP